MMQTPSPPLPLPIPRRSSHSHSHSTATTTGSSTSKSPPASSYTASLPATYRRSSFPVSPSVLLTTTHPDSGQTTTLPPGLTFERRGCRDDDDYERATGSRAPFFAKYQSHSYSHSASSSRSHSVESSRHNSASSTDLPNVGWLKTSGRSWSVNSGTAAARSTEDKKKREAVKGWEDPALAAARRALWDDSDEVAPGDRGNDSASAVEDEDEVSLLRDKNRQGGMPGNDDEEAVEFDDDVDGDGPSDEDDETDSDSTPPALLRPPCHSTLSPGPSCLRSSSRSSLSPSPRFSSLSLSQDPSLSSSSSPPQSSSIERGVSPSPSSSHSNSSSCSTSLTTSPSIRFSPDPPKTVPTYSKIDYERKGDLPVEKLSIREWIELQGVREAVGVWSGKIAKWEENVDGPPPSTSSTTTTATTTPTTTPTSSSIASGTGTSGARPSLSLAALTGVVTVSKSTPSSPTSASPRIGSASLPVFSPTITN